MPLQISCRQWWILGLAAFAATGCRDPRPAVVVPSEPEVAYVDTVPKKLDVTLDLPGRVVPYRTADIRPQVGGIVVRRDFEQGADVRANQRLFVINPAPFEAERDVARASLKKAQAVLDRMQIQVARIKSLVAMEAVSQQSFDDAISQRDQAIADVAQARAALGRRQLDVRFAVVEAPISGRIGPALVTEGALVSSGDTSPMAQIQQIDKVFVDVKRPASSFPMFVDREGTQKDVRADGSVGTVQGSGVPVALFDGDHRRYEMDARLLFTGVTIDAGTGDLQVRMAVDNPRRTLLPGMFVWARVRVASYPSALVIPQQAVLRSGGTAHVWTLDEANRGHLQTVVLGELVDRDYRVAAGLRAGQRVVVEGGERMNEGGVVKPQAWKMAGTVASTSTGVSGVADVSGPAAAVRNPVDPVDPVDTDAPFGPGPKGAA